MPRSYWLPIVAVVGLVLASPAGHCGDSKHAAATQQQRNASQSAPIQKAYQSNRFTPNCNPGSYDRNSPLCAEWKVADAAKQAADAADGTITIGWIGVAFTGLIMAAAVAAAIYAKRAADAAKSTITVMRNMGYAENRAYLSVEEALIYQGWLDPFISLKLVNTGATPARWVEIESNVRLAPSGTLAADTEKDFTGKRQRWPTDPRRGNEFKISPTTADGRELQDLLDETDTGRHILVLQGTIRWKTMFGEVFESAFYFFGNAPLGHVKKTDDGEVEIPARMIRPCLPVPTYQQIRGADEASERGKQQANQ